ncbi:MAG: GPW/gp25 family protein [Solirubrobacteraceae bacterium]|nr:GPW/gp25 family protein [Solirubrobacteraceae bacterium]
MTDIIGTGLAFPLSVDRRGALALARDDEDVRQAISIVLSTPAGERPMRPEFGCGVHDCVFDVIDAAALGRMEAEIRRALERWEPRIDVLSVDFELDESADGPLAITIEYRLRATNDVRNLVYPFYVVPADEVA